MPRLVTTIATLSLALLWGSMSGAAPIAYKLDPAVSIVGFETDFGPDRIRGHMPVSSAELVIDFDSLARCSVAVTLAADGANASFPFATQALRGAKVLDATNHPEIRFVSNRIRTEGDGARVEGTVTIRGVSRPVALHARFTRPPGSAPDDKSNLTIRLTGAVNRSDFGATGWADMVGDEVRLDIIARIHPAS